jgi:heme-degrading monooxygenase HmoA
MIAVIFEVWPKPERKKEYLDIAAQLRPILEKIDGFISIERFGTVKSVEPFINGLPAGRRDEHA